MLPKTNRQEWHETILNYLQTRQDSWSRPQNIHGIRFERVYELLDNKFIEMKMDYETRAAPAKTFKITQRGLVYLSMFNSGDLFNPDKWGTIELVFYMICGDERALFPYLLQFLFNDSLSDIEQETLYNVCSNHENGFLRLVSLLIENQKEQSRLAIPNISWIPSNLYDEWESDNTLTTEKRLNTKISFVSFVALQKIIAHLEEIGLRKHLISRKGSEGLATELSLVLTASIIEELL